MKKVLVLGAFGKTGIAVINYLVKKGYKVEANDLKKDIPAELKKLDNIEFYLGEHSLNLLKEIEFIVISPGVPSNLPVVLKAMELSIPVLSEIELAYKEFPYNWIGITGTDGKSTTTALTGTILKEAKKNIVVGGNIGEPLISSLVNKPKETIVVAELSSFQLENIVHFKPLIGVLLNIAPDHLDRYSSMEEYITAKLNLFRNQTEREHSIFNYDDSFTQNYLSNVKSNKYFFSLHRRISNGAFYSNGKFFWNENTHSWEIADETEMKIYGEHNKANILASIAIAKLLKIPDSAIKKGINKFKGLPHRMELVAEIDNRKFINDSKATTVSAVQMSIRSIQGKGIIIMGGRDKGLDFSILNEILSKKAKYLIVLGEAKEKIKKSINLAPEQIIEKDTMEEAVFESYRLSDPGDTILLSPGCASFDMFKNFEERGDIFKENVLKLKRFHKTVVPA